jgi:hypothetical protein
LVEVIFGLCKLLVGSVVEKLPCIDMHNGRILDYLPDCEERLLYESYMFA